MKEITEIKIEIALPNDAVDRLRLAILALATLIEPQVESSAESLSCLTNLLVEELFENDDDTSHAPNYVLLLKAAEGGRCALVSNMRKDEHTKLVMQHLQELTTDAH